MEMGDRIFKNLQSEAPYYSVPNSIISYSFNFHFHLIFISFSFNFRLIFISFSFHLKITYAG